MVGRIYDLYSTEDPYRFYVGSTELTLGERLRLHWTDKYHKALVYQHLRKYDLETWHIELVEECNKTGVELKKLEEFWRVTLRAPLNMIRAYRTPEEKRAQSRNWLAANPERRRQHVLKHALKRDPEKYRTANRAANSRYYYANLKECRTRSRYNQRKKYAGKKIFPFFRAAQARAAFQLKIST